MSQAIATTNEEPPFARKLKAALDLSKEKMLAVLPRHLTPERMIQLATTAVFRTPELQKCDPMTIVAAVVEASELGLEIGGARGEGYLIPRWNSKAGKKECQFQPGYRGLVKLATNSSEIKSIHAYTFHAQDFFDYELGVDVRLTHKPAIGDRGKVLGVYCAGRLASGEAFAEVMDVETVERIRGYSQTPDSGPWMTEWEEMARKTVTRRKLKMLPCSSEKLHRAIELDNRDYNFDDQPSLPPAEQRMIAGQSLTERLNSERVSSEPPEDAFAEAENKPFDEAGLKQELRDSLNKTLKRMDKDEKSQFLASHNVDSVAAASVDGLQAMIDELAGR